MIEQLKATYSNAPPLHKAIVIGGIILTLLALSGFVAGFVSKIKDARFDREIQVMKDARQVEVTRADDAEKRAIAAENEKAKLEIVMELASEKSRLAMEKVNEAQKKFDAESARIGGDIEPCVRYAELRAALNLPAKACQESTADNR